MCIVCEVHGFYTIYILFMYSKASNIGTLEYQKYPVSNNVYIIIIIKFATSKHSSENATMFISQTRMFAEQIQKILNYRKFDCVCECLYWYTHIYV